MDNKTRARIIDQLVEQAVPHMNEVLKCIASADMLGCSPDDFLSCVHERQSVYEVDEEQTESDASIISNLDTMAEILKVLAEVLALLDDDDTRHVLLS